MLTRSSSVKSLLPLTLLLTLIVAACSPAPSVTSVTTTLGSTSIMVNDTTQADATVVVAGGASQNVTWASSNTAVATVNSAGLVTGVGAGTTKITATSTTDTTKSGSATLTVTSPLAGRSVVYYNDGVLGTDEALAALDASALAYGLDVTIATDANFVGLLAAKPDLVVYNRQDGFGLYTGHAAALTTWVNGGGYLAFTDFDATNTEVAGVLAALQAASDGHNNNASMTITGPLLATGLSSTTVAFTNPSTGWGTYNVGLAAQPGGTVLATYDGVDSAAIVSGHGGRTMALGFLSDTVPAGDGQRLYTNIFGELMRHRAHAGF
ncbi:MAG: Ig-like domain-containing protein [Trueperaceae bacterium]